MIIILRDKKRDILQVYHVFEIQWINWMRFKIHFEDRGVFVYSIGERV